jgi:proteic killer suppression protein
MIQVQLHKVAKQLQKLPTFVIDKLNAWIRSVEREGIREVRKILGYHDEPLKGDRKGQKSIRLTKAYRAIYTESKLGNIEFIIVEEVNKHEY